MPKTRSNETDVDHQNGDNVTDTVRRQYYRDALMARIGLESAQATVKNKALVLREVLKSAKRAGIDPRAITRVLGARLQDENELITQLREELKVFDLSGVVSNIKEKLLDRLDIEEPTSSVEAQISQDRAYDAGAFDYRVNISRNDNKYVPGTSMFDAWDRGWLAAQEITAYE